MEYQAFSDFIVRRGDELFRSMPWRSDVRPYYILVSELMLQQTQVARVIPKFAAFIAVFPDSKTLAAAPLADVLVLWSGLGYNRRAKFLHESAKMIEREFGGTMPTTLAELQKLPGVGANTAGAIMTYAYNQPVPFVETNVRTVYLHHFFVDETEVTDAQIRDILQKTLPPNSPREFYWALMDYGTHLKAAGVRNNAKSRHYKKQSALEGSLRQIRGQIVRDLTARDLAITELLDRYGDDARFASAFEGLQKDGLIQQNNTEVHLTK